MYMFCSGQQNTKNTTVEVIDYIYNPKCTNCHVKKDYFKYDRNAKLPSKQAPNMELENV